MKLLATLILLGIAVVAGAESGGGELLPPQCESGGGEWTAPQCESGGGE